MSDRRTQINLRLPVELHERLCASLVKVNRYREGRGMGPISRNQLMLNSLSGWFEVLDDAFREDR